MNIKSEIRVEKKITVTETDIVNGGEVLVLTAYAVKEDNNLYSYPAPQIFNEELYAKNKNNYDAAVKEFRINCE